MSYQLITLDRNIILSWAYPNTGGLVVADINDVNSSNDNYTLTLPPANLVATGTTLLLNNVGFYDFTLLDNSGAPVGLVILSGEVRQIYLTSSNTVGGIWQVIPFGGGASGITAFSTTSTNNSINIAPGTVTPTTASIDFTLSASLQNLNELTDVAIPSFLVITNNLPLQWTTRSLVAGANIDIANPDGVADNPIINLQSSLTGLTNVTVSDVAGNSSVITSTSIVITDSATGNSTNISSTGVITSSLVANPVNAAAWVCFSDTGSGCTSAIVIQDSYNIAAVTGAAGIYTITFNNPFVSATYAVLTSLQRGSSTLLPFQTFVQQKGINSLIVACVDTLGNLLAPYDGMSIVVFAS